MTLKPPAIDWELALKLVGNKREIAEEILGLLIKTLPNDWLAIKQANENNNHEELYKRIHKLHGAVCYCGTPRLKKTLSTLETALKNNETKNISNLVTELETEVGYILHTNSPFEKGGYRGI